MPTGTSLRDQGVADVLAADVAINRNFRSLIDQAVAEFVKAGITFSADDIHDWIERHHPGAEPHHVNVWGGAIREAVKGLAIPDGAVESTRPERRTGLIRKYRPIARRAA